jgi:hypothetical protein
MPVAPISKPRSLDPRTAAALADTPEECESQAVEERRASAQRGWDVLNACLDRGRFPRRLFTNWSLVLDHWRAELKTHADAPRFIARMIAFRGGDVQGDVDQLQRNGIPLLSLSDASSDIDARKGRLIVVRGELIEGVKWVPPGASLFVETTLRSVPMRSSRYNINETFVERSFGTGNFAFMKAGPKGSDLMTAREYVLLVRVDGSMTSTRWSGKMPLLTVVAGYLPSSTLYD